MGYRRFVDRDGREWEIRDLSRATWRFEPASGNRETGFEADAPGHEGDPFEVSVEELQRLLDAVHGPPRVAPRKRSPFGDD